MSPLRNSAPGGSTDTSTAGHTGRSQLNEASTISNRTPIFHTTMSTRTRLTLRPGTCLACRTSSAATDVGQVGQQVAGQGAVAVAVVAGVVEAVARLPIEVCDGAARRPSEWTWRRLYVEPTVDWCSEAHVPERFDLQVTDYSVADFSSADDQAAPVRPASCCKEHAVGAPSGSRSAPAWRLRRPTSRPASTCSPRATPPGLLLRATKLTPCPSHSPTASRASQSRRPLQAQRVPGRTRPQPAAKIINRRAPPVDFHQAAGDLHDHPHVPARFKHPSRSRSSPSRTTAPASCPPLKPCR